jgi:hypothetical protein
MEKIKIVCAAIRAEDGSILVGIRHYSPDMIEQMKARTDGSKFYHRSGDDQGFVDQFGNYYTRENAFLIASVNGQIKRNLGFLSIPTKLFSEHLY